MCDQTEVSYLPNDVVWVKLSNVWWPAQVQDETKLEEDVTSGLRKKPLAVVKFFDEDLYEFPKNLNQIYHYNCFKKDEFIKKGLDLCRPSGYREVSDNMKKFPLDIKKAETLTGGNPDIIYDPKYLPEEKFDYREQFGLKPRKKTSMGLKHNGSDSSTETPKQSRVKFSTPVSAPSTSRTPEMKISNSTKSLSTNPVKRLSTMKRAASGLVRVENFDKENESHRYSSNQYNCSYCNFTCGRMGVIIEHYRSHYSGLIFPPPTHIPHNYYKIFQCNFLKHKECVSSTPVAVPKYVSEKAVVKKKLVEDTTPIKKRKYESLKKEKTPAAAPGSSLAVPIKDIVGSAGTPKKRPRKSKDMKSVIVKEPEALDILKDWEDDLEEEAEIKLNSSEPVENDTKDTSKNISDSLSENEEQSQQPLQDHKSPASKEKCCFDFEDNDESLNLNKSLKFGQKLPRVIAEEKPNVQRLLKELQETKESPLMKEEPMNEDFSEEIENLLKSTEVPKLPDIPHKSLPKPIENSFTEDSSNSEKEVIEGKDLKEPIDKVSSQEIEMQSEDSSSMITSSQPVVQSTEVTLDKFTDSKNDSSDESLCKEIKKKIDLLNKSFEERNISSSTKKNNSSIPETADSDIKDIEEKEHTSLEENSSKDSLSIDISENNESKSSLSESESHLIKKNDTDEPDMALSSSTLGSSFGGKNVNKDEIKNSFENISESDKKVKNSPAEEDVPNVKNAVEDDSSTPMEVENCDEMVTCRAEDQQGLSEKNDSVDGIENTSILEAKSSNENDGKSHKENGVKASDKQSEFNPSPTDDAIKIQVVSSSVKNDKDTKFEPSKTSDTPTDQIPFDINSMPIVIDQDPIMEIMEGHVEPLPNADVVRLYIRNSGEEEPEDFQSPRRLLTVSPPPPNLPPIPGIKKVPLPPPKSKNGANSSNKISGNSASSSSTRYTLNKQPAKNVPQPKILFIKSTTGAPGKLLIPQQQSSLFAPTGKLQPGTRILTTNTQLVSKTPVPKKVTSKSIVVGKQGFPTSAKVVPKSVIGQVIHKVSQQPVICNKNTSTVLVNSKTIVNRQVGRNVLLASPQLKTPATMQVTGAKVVKAGQVIKTPASVFKQAESVLPHKVVQSTSTLSENKKQILKNKQLSPNILQRTQRKPARQQVIKKSQLLTIPSSVQQQSAEVVAVNNLPIVQGITSHSSSEPVKMLYLVDNSQYSVENPVIPVENDNQNIFVTSTSNSGNIDNIIFSIDGTTNFVNISGDTSTSSSTHVPSQDILAKALANTQVLQSETNDIVDGESTVYVDQQFQAPSLSNTVLETSLTLNQPPIMTPLEVPSSITPQSNISHIIPISNITKKADIPQPSMPLLTDEVEVPGNAVFLSDTSAIPTTSGHLTFQLVHDNNLVVSSGIVPDKTSKSSPENKEDNVLPEFLKGNFGNKSEKDTSPKRGER